VRKIQASKKKPIALPQTAAPDLTFFFFPLEPVYRGYKTRKEYKNWLEAARAAQQGNVHKILG
jgi:hypothetical protein